MVKKAALTGGNCRSALGWFAEGWGRGYDQCMIRNDKNACFPCDRCGYTPLCSVLLLCTSGMANSSKTCVWCSGACMLCCFMYVLGLVL